VKEKGRQTRCWVCQASRYRRCDPCATKSLWLRWVEWQERCLRCIRCAIGLPTTEGGDWEAVKFTATIGDGECRCVFGPHLCHVVALLRCGRFGGFRGDKRLARRA